MTSEFFNMLKSTLEQTSLGRESDGLLRRYCLESGVKPDTVDVDNSALLIMKLMSEIGSKLSSTEWEDLDKNLKNIMSSGEEPIKGKVKGLVLNRIVAFIQRKRGKQTIESLKKALNHELVFKVHSWYPLSFFEDLLIECRRLNGGKSRFVEMGADVTYHNNSPQLEHLFGKGQTSTESALNNMEEMFLLDEFMSEGSNGKATITFSNAGTGTVTKFISGAYEGILRRRGANHISVVRLDAGEGTARIAISFQEARG